MNKQVTILLSIIGALILGIGLLFYTKILEIKMVDKSDKVQSFQFKSIDGKEFNINAQNRRFNVKELEGKTLFLQIFSWDCDFCEKEIPQLIKLKKSLGNRFDIIAIEAGNDTKEHAKEFIKKYGINYNIILGENHKDFYIYLQKHYGWDGVIPLTIVLSKEGYVLAFEKGFKSYSLSELLKASLLKE